MYFSCCCPISVPVNFVSEFSCPTCLALLTERFGKLRRADSTLHSFFSTLVSGRSSTSLVDFPLTSLIILPSWCGFPAGVENCKLSHLTSSHLNIKRAINMGSCSSKASRRSAPDDNGPSDHEVQQSRVDPEQSFTGPTPLSWYHSPRIQDMIEKKKRGDFRTEVEFHIDSSTVHHSELGISTCQTQHPGMTNQEYYDLLKRIKYVRQGPHLVPVPCSDEWELPSRSLFSGHWDDGNLVVGEKLAEGGQAEIYAATDRDGRNMVLKVFRDGTVLQDLERQFPPALLMFHQGDEYVKGMFLQSHLFGATLLKGRKLFGRFALVMERRWGDLRRLIDQRMMHSSCNRGPPFSTRRVLHLMLQIASQMRDLHGLRPPILHRDLKASNVLVHCPVSKEPDENRDYKVYVVDYECSLGVVGTGFWRAPEILQLMRERIPVSEKVFTQKCDVYSYGMVCYELVTGHIPFEGHSLTEYDMVLDGDRPELPLDLNPVVKDIIVGCWHGIPSDRPSLEDIVKKLEANAK